VRNKPHRIIGCAVLAVLMLLGSTRLVRAGAYLTAGEGSENRILHPTGYDGTGGTLNVSVCIDPTSANAAEMVIPVKNVVTTFNSLNPTTENLTSANVPFFEYDFESVALHELGHSLALHHPHLEDYPDYTQSTHGANDVFDLDDGSDNVSGSADDVRGDDGNLHWFRRSNNNPFTIAGTVDSSTYSLDLADLPLGDSFATNANRDVATLLGFSNTESVMVQGAHIGEAQRELAHDDVATLLYAMSGLDETAEPADPNSDDYTLSLSYAGLTTSCDIVLDFDPNWTGFASCWWSPSPSIPPTSHHFAIASAFIVFNTSVVTWFFNDVLAEEDPCGDGLLDPNANEECDDGNQSSCDGCSSQCQIETGFLCGDGEFNPACDPECDDGNLVDDDGCDSNCTFTACGNGIQTSGEECDDGNTADGDGCSGLCVVEFCGDGVLQTGLGEKCDDGNNQDGDGCSGDCQIEQEQNRDQQKCINELNKNFAKVAKVQGKDICTCIRDGSKGKLGAQSIEECSTSDNKNKVDDATDKTLSKERIRCRFPDLPDLGYTSGANVNQVAIGKELALIHEIFGSDLDASIISEADNQDASRCQVEVAKATQKCQDAKLKAFNRCKKNGLKGKVAPPGADLPFDDRSDLALCMGYDPKGKIPKFCNTKLAEKINEGCAGVDTVVAFPPCNTADRGQLRTCLDELVECQVCLALNAADDLVRDCDAFDDGAVNGSCP
jgi:cysteine-rich repeat protein